jgi:uncharacterized protein (DUF58 family)
VRSALATALLGIAFLFAAALVDAEPLWVPGIVLLVLAGGSVVWVALAARGVTVRRTLGAARVVEDEPLSIVLDVRPGVLPLPCARVLDPLLTEAAPLPAGRRGGRVRISARFARRGHHALGLTRLTIADPLGLATREVGARPSAGDDEVLVLPRIERLLTSAAGGDATQVVRNARRLVGAEVELDGIRPLRDGTPASRIFWPAVARGADAQERYLHADGDSRPLVILDPSGATELEQLDAAVRAAASIAHALARSGGCGELLPGDRRPAEISESLAGWAQVHARLALVEPAGAPSATSAAQRRGAVIYVSARRRAALPRALSSGQGATRILVVPGELGGREPLFSVAACNAYVVGVQRPAGARSGVMRGAR